MRVFADIQNFALCAHCVHGIPKKGEKCVAREDNMTQLSFLR